MRLDASMRLRRSGLSLALAALVTLGCGASEDVVIKTPDGVSLSAADIDRDPLRLLPPGAGAVLQVDVAAAWRSPLGADLLPLAERILPIPKSANFVPSRDLQRMVLGLYAFAGVDFAGVASGTFDPQAIEQSANAAELTPLGTPLVKLEYAGRRFFVSGNVGFVVLTKHTALFGNEVGMRRVLDRLARGEVGVALSKEIEQLLRTPNAPVALGVDARDAVQLESFRTQAAFVDGLELVQAVANFEQPGLNVAATLSYTDTARAAAGKGSLDLLGGVVQGLGFVSGLFGGRAPLQRYESVLAERSVQVVAAVDGAAVVELLTNAASRVNAGKGSSSSGSAAPSTPAPTATPAASTPAASSAGSSTAGASTAAAPGMNPSNTSAAPSAPPSAAAGAKP